MKALSIVRAKHVDGHKLQLSFSDLTQQVVDFKSFLQKSNLPDLKKYRKVSNFKKFKLKAGNLIWGDFEMLFPLEDLYKNQLVKTPTKSKQSA